MKRLTILTLLAGSVLWAGPNELLDFNEKVHRQVLNESKGKVVLFDFWATWCAPCREEMPLLVKLQKSLPADSFRLITVSADDPKDKQAALAFLQQNDVPAPAFLKSVADDEKFIDAIDPKWYGALPALFLYDRTGKLVQSFIGETEIDKIESAIRSHL
jgi:thiol-disulfide isomerase/thioredoxin